MATNEYLARCLRGLEWLLAAELRARLGVQPSEIGHREVFFTAGARQDVLDLGVADDLFLVAGRIDDVSHTRDGLKYLSERVAQLPLRQTLEQLKRFRNFSPKEPFEVVASFLGKRNYSRDEIELRVAEAIALRTGQRFIPHSPGARTTASWRIHIRDGAAVLALRIAPKALHRRDYKQDSRPGSLHPPLARAMAILADLRPRHVVLDPFCGAGTILVEAFRVEPEAILIGSDCDAAAIEAANSNANRAMARVELKLADAGSLSLEAGSVHRVITNLPWGRAVAPKGSLSHSFQGFFDEMERVCSPCRKIILLVDAEHESKIREQGYLLANSAFRVRVFGRWATVAMIGGGPPDFDNINQKISLSLREYWPNRCPID